MENGNVELCTGGWLVVMLDVFLRFLFIRCADFYLCFLDLVAAFELMIPVSAFILVSGTGV